MSPAPDAAATIRRLVRDIPDWPKPGVVFKDITPLLDDAAGFATVIDALVEAGTVPGRRIDQVLGRRGPGLRVRRAGRLPPRCRVRAGAQGRQAAVRDRGRGVRPRVRRRPPRDPPRRGACPASGCSIVDDVLATGGTAAATARLVEKLGGVVAASPSSWSWPSSTAAWPCPATTSHALVDLRRRLRRRGRGRRRPGSGGVARWPPSTGSCPGDATARRPSEELAPLRRGLPRPPPPGRRPA